MLGRVVVLMWFGAGKGWSVWLMVGVFLLLMGPVQAAPSSFDEKQAAAILCGGNDGWWIDGQTYRRIHFNQATTRIFAVGYANEKGDSVLEFENRGTHFKMYVSYYSDQNRYYAKIFYRVAGAKELRLLSECAMREP